MCRHPVGQVSIRIESTCRAGRGSTTRGRVTTTHQVVLERVVRRGGLEPPARCLEARCEGAGQSVWPGERPSLDEWPSFLVGPSIPWARGTDVVQNRRREPRGLGRGGAATPLTGAALGTMEAELVCLLGASPNGPSGAFPSALAFGPASVGPSRKGKRY